MNELAEERGTKKRYGTARVEPINFRTKCGEVLDQNHLRDHEAVSIDA